MIKQMLRIWMAIPFIMFFFIVTGIAADFMWRLTEEYFYPVAIGGLLLSLSGLVIATREFLKK